MPIYLIVIAKYSRATNNTDIFDLVVCDLQLFQPI
jgi:hypothetical protein